MSKITPELLRQMVGVKSGQRPLIDQLVGPLNLCLPAYGITTEYRICGFLATAAPESDWFKTLREYGKGSGRAYGKPDKITGLIYYGRGIFQNTWKKGYQAFTEYVADNWASIQGRAAEYGYHTAPDFVAKPELLATPYWAVEAACWYWKANHLAKWADKGLTGFFGLEGLVNRGSAEKKALQYNDRLNSYETARRIIADDFSLDSAAAEPAMPDLDQSKTKDSSESATPDASQAEGPAPPPTDEIPTSPANKTDVVIEKESEVTETKPKGFFGALWQKVTGALGGGVTADVAIEKAQQAQALGLSERTWTFIFWAIIAGLVIWIVYHFVVVKVLPWGKWIMGRIRTNQLVASNGGGDSVQVISSDKLAEYQAKGYLVVNRS